MQRTFLIVLFCFCLTGLTLAQVSSPSASGFTNSGVSTENAWFGNALSAEASSVGVFADDGPISAVDPPRDSPINLVVPVALPRMAPELALQVYQRRSATQAARLTSYSATTLIDARLPDSGQSGKFETRRQYSAPRSLEFKPMRFTGDSFVKSNVIIRVLQSEADHVQKDDPTLNAISAANYKFSYRGTTSMQDRLLHIYQVKPRYKRAGLFKGRIYLDAHTGTLARVEGRPVRSPSFFVSRIEFVQDYADFGQFTFPVHVHSEARARIVGRTILDMYHSDYLPVANMAETAQQLLAY